MWNGWRLSAAWGAAIAAISLAGVLASGAPAAVVGPLAWGTPVLVEPPGPPIGGFPSQGLGEISCPSASLCAAVAAAGDVVTSTNPTGGAQAWNVTHVDSNTVGSGGETRLAGPTAVSCPSVSLCVAVDSVGGVFTSTHPSAGASSWTGAQIAGAPDLSAISCPSVGLCVAIDEVAGDVVSSTDPTAGAQSWHTAAIDPSHCQGVSGLCATKALLSLACPSASLCLTTTWNGYALTSMNPSGDAGTWSAARIDTSRISVLTAGSQPAGVGSLSCPSVALCVATDQAGNVLASRDPAGGSAAWRLVNPATAPISLGTNISVSCASVSRCVALAPQGSLLDATPLLAGNVVATTDEPLSGGPWTEAISVGQDQLDGLSCPSVAFCVVTEAPGNVIVGQASLLSRATLAGLVRGALARARTPSRAAVLRGRALTASFNTPSAGSLILRWYITSTARHSNRRPTLLADGRAHSATAQTLTIDLALRKTGLSLLRHAHPVRLTADVTFSPTDGPPVTATRVLTLGH